MRKFAKTLLIAMSLIAVAATSAQAANGIALNTQGPITANGTLTMNGNIICTVSLTLTTSSLTLLKNNAIDQATVTAGTITNCSSSIGVTGGAVLVPIRVRYASFTGTLPNISGINITAPNAGFRLDSSLGVSCLYGGNMTGITFEVSSGVIRTVRFNSNALPRVSGGFLCPSTGTVVGPLTVLTTVTARLV